MKAKLDDEAEGVYERVCGRGGAVGAAEWADAARTGGEPGRRAVDENAILRQERDILKRATAFFAKDGS